MQSGIYDYCERVSTSRRKELDGCIDPKRNHLCDKGVSFRSNDRVRQRNLLPVSSVCCRSLSGRYVNFITPKKAEREDGWQQSRNSAALSYSFHVLLGGPYRSLVARLNLYRAPEQRPSNSVGTIKVEKEERPGFSTNSLVSSVEHASFCQTLWFTTNFTNFCIFADDINPPREFHVLNFSFQLLILNYQTLMKLQVRYYGILVKFLEKLAMNQFLWNNLSGKFKHEKYEVYIPRSKLLLLCGPQCATIRS